MCFQMFDLVSGRNVVRLLVLLLWFRSIRIAAVRVYIRRSISISFRAFQFFTWFSDGWFFRQHIVALVGFRLAMIFELQINSHFLIAEVSRDIKQYAHANKKKKSFSIIHLA